MKSVVLAIGCNLYNSLSELDGAEADAIAVYKLLTDQSEYDEEKSILLINPTTQDIRSRVSAVIVGADIDALTLYYAGHGAFMGNRFYLTGSDSDSDSLSMSALCIEDVFALLPNTNIKQVNLIVDACNASGAQFGINSFLASAYECGSKCSLSIIAACRESQFAGEVDDGSHGVFTEQLLLCMRGEGGYSIESSAKYLSLSTIGDSLCASAVWDGDQQPVSGGVSMYGVGHFCINPCISDDTTIAIDSVFGAVALSKESKDIVKKYSNSILALLRNDEGLIGYKLSNKVTSLFCDLLKSGASESEVGSIAYGLVETSLPETYSDPISLLDVRAAIALNFCEAAFVVNSEVSLSALSFLMDVIHKGAKDVCDHLLESIRVESGLIELGQGMGDLFFLPIKITKILGWLGIFKTISTDANEKLVNELIRVILSKNESAVALVSDEQAAPLMVIFESCYESELHEDMQLLLTLLYDDFSGKQGNALRMTSSSHQQLDYILALAKMKQLDTEPLAKPSLLLTMLFYHGLKYERISEWHLLPFDNKHTNVFLPECYSSTLCRNIERGVNVHLKIGGDIFNLNEFKDKYKSTFERFASLKEDASIEIETASRVASLIYPDRLIF
jgi:hypothetical protein